MAGRRGRAPAAGMTRLFVGAGRAPGIRPQDLVGAIAGETPARAAATSAPSRSPTASRWSRCPEAAADEVIAALRASTIKGKRTTVRRERDEAR